MKFQLQPETVHIIYIGKPKNIYRGSDNNPNVTCQTFEDKYSLRNVDETYRVVDPVVSEFTGWVVGCVRCVLGVRGQ